MTRLLLPCTALVLLLAGCASPENLDGPPPAPSVPEPPDVQLSEDDEIETLIMSSLNRQPMGNADITVSSFNGIVLLTGQVLSESARNEATSAAAFSQVNMSRLVNELRVVDRITEADDEAEAALAETITRRIGELEGIDAQRVHVVVDRGTAYLIFMMPPDQAQAAVEAASAVAGVEDIRTVYSYSD